MTAHSLTAVLRSRHQLLQQWTFLTTKNGNPTEPRKVSPRPLSNSTGHRSERHVHIEKRIDTHPTPNTHTLSGRCDESNAFEAGCRSWKSSRPALPRGMLERLAG